MFNISDAILLEVMFRLWMGDYYDVGYGHNVQGPSFRRAFEARLAILIN